MAIKLTDKVKRLIDAKNFAHVVTLNKDGSPQVSPVWIERDGDTIVVNSEQKRRKVRNVKRDPRVTVSVLNAENPYEYAEIRGRVTEITADGGFEGIDRLSKKYTGQEKYPGNLPGDVRVQIKIQPEHITGMG